MGKFSSDSGLSFEKVECDNHLIYVDKSNLIADVSSIIVLTNQIFLIRIFSTDFLRKRWASTFKNLERDNSSINQSDVETSASWAETHAARLFRTVLVASDEVTHMDEVRAEQLYAVVVAVKDEYVAERVDSHTDGRI